MTVKYQIRCSDSDIYVLEKDGGFHLTIGSRVNPLSFGSEIADFISLGKAIDAADLFCKLHALSKEYGYHLHNSEFHKEGLQSISVLGLLQLNCSPEHLRELLEEEASLHRT